MLKKALNQKQTKHSDFRNKSSNLWLGFAVGAITATSLAFLFGTQKGRQILKKLLEISENLEENALAIAEELEEMLAEKAENFSQQQQNKPILGTLLDKIKTLRT